MFLILLSEIGFVFCLLLFICYWWNKGEWIGWKWTRASVQLKGFPMITIHFHGFYFWLCILSGKKLWNCFSFVHLCEGGDVLLLNLSFFTHSSLVLLDYAWCIVNTHISSAFSCSNANLYFVFDNVKVNHGAIFGVCLWKGALVLVHNTWELET